MEQGSPWNIHATDFAANCVFLQRENFCFRGQKEHISLALSQVVRGTNPDRNTYCEHGSKNHSGGVVDQTAGKVVTIVDTGGPSSHVALLDLYLNKRPTAKLDDTNHILSIL